MWVNTCTRRPTEENTINQGPSKHQDTACSFGKKYVLGGKWFNLVFSVDLKVVNKAFSI